MSTEPSTAESVNGRTLPVHANFVLTHGHIARALGLRWAHCRITQYVRAAYVVCETKLNVHVARTQPAMTPNANIPRMCALSPRLCTHIINYICVHTCVHFCCFALYIVTTTTEKQSFAKWKIKTNNAHESLTNTHIATYRVD